MTSSNRFFQLAITFFVLFPAISAFGQAGLMATNRIHEFGEVGIDFDLFHTFEIINRSDSPAHIDSVNITCDCSTVSFLDSTIQAGDTALIHLKFNTKNYYGDVSKAVYVYSDLAISPKLDLFYKATVGQWYYGLKPDPISLFFLPRVKPKKINIVNTQLSGVEITEILPTDSFVVVQLLQGIAGKGDTLALIVQPSESLTKGTYFSNFRIKIKPTEEIDAVYMSIPVKIVRY